jgi:uncharacterized membrane protein
MTLPGMQVQQISWQGPFPPPEAIKGYEQVLPGSFDRIMTMAEEAQRAQIETVREAQKLTSRDTARGAWLGFVVTLTAIGAAIWCASMKQPWVASLFLAVPVMAVAKALVQAKRAGAKAVQKSDSHSG